MKRILYFIVISIMAFLVGCSQEKVSNPPQNNNTTYERSNDITQKYESTELPEEIEELEGSTSGQDIEPSNQMDYDQVDKIEFGYEKEPNNGMYTTEDDYTIVNPDESIDTFSSETNEWNHTPGPSGDIRINNNKEGGWTSEVRNPDGSVDRYYPDFGWKHEPK